MVNSVSILRETKVDSKGREIESRVRAVEKVETATDENFQQHFVDALAIPHASHTFPRLSSVVTLPSTILKNTKRKRRSID